MIHPYVFGFQELLEVHADPVKAIPIKKYLRNQFDSFGLMAQERRMLQRQFLKDQGIPPKNELSEIIKDCWNLPQREFQYFGQELMEKFMKPAELHYLTIYEFMITNKSWWDTVDFIASKLVGSFFIQFPEQVNPVNEKWLSGGNIWLQRTAILFQLKYKSKTNTALLSKNILHCATSKEFFIQKAIGWALREFSKTDPGFVIDFVNTHDLAPLSEREGLKWLGSRQ